MPKRSAQKKRSYKRSKKKKNKDKLKKFLTTASLFMLSVIFLSGYLGYKRLTKEFTSAFSSSSQDALSDDIFTTAFLVVDDFESEPLIVRKAKLYVFDKSTLKLIIYNIPVDTVIDVPGRFSEEPVSNILALGLLNGDDLYQSSELFSKSIFKMLAFPVDRYILVESSGENFYRGIFSGSFYLNEVSELEYLKDMIRTNMDISQLYKIYTFTKSLPEDRILKKELGDTYLENSNIIDEEFMDLTFDSELSNEKKNIAVLNGSVEPGVAGFGARVIKNFGGRVVAVGNTKNTYEKSTIITDDPISESTRIISQIFGIERIVLYSEAHNFPENEINRSDVTVILGIDFASSL